MIGAIIGDIVGSRFEFNNTFSKNFDLLCRDFFCDFNPNHAWFLFDGYGNLQSFQYVDFYFEDDDFLLDEIQEWYQR